MKFDRSDFARIRVSLLAAVVMLALGGGFIWLTEKRHRDALQIQKSAQTQLVEFENKLRQVRAEENEIKEKAALFSQLYSRGIIGEEQRLDWVELLRDIRESRKLLDLQYEFAPQQALENAGASSYAFKSSTMRMRLKMLHELDLLNLINDLRAQAKAYVRVRSCNVVRTPRGGIAGGETALLNAECELEWITIQPAKSTR